MNQQYLTPWFNDIQCYIISFNYTVIRFNESDKFKNHQTNFPISLRCNEYDHPKFMIIIRAVCRTLNPTYALISSLSSCVEHIIANLLPHHLSGSLFEIVFRQHDITNPIDSNTYNNWQRFHFYLSKWMHNIFSS